MTDERTPKKVSGEVLPPLRQQVSLTQDLPPGTPLGIPMLGRAKFESHARTFEAYVRMRNAQMDAHTAELRVYKAVEDKLEAQERLGKALQRYQHLDQILKVEEAKLLAGLDRDLESIADQRETSGNKAYERRAARAEAEARAIEAERRLEALKKPPQPAQNTEPKLSKAQRAARDMAQVKRDFEELRNLLVAAAGGEDKLTEEDRAEIDTLELHRTESIRQIMEGL